MTTFIVLTCLMFGGAILYGIIVTSMQDQQAKESARIASNQIERALKSFPNFSVTSGVFGAGQNLLIDEERRKILLIAENVAKEVDFDVLLSADITSNGHTTTSTHKTGTLGRAVTGGILAGGAGAVIGAVTAKSIQIDEALVTSIDLVVLTSDPAFPCMKWNYFSPHGLNQGLKSFQVWIYMEAAIKAYNSLAPVFVLTPTEANGLVAI